MVFLNWTALEHPKYENEVLGKMHKMEKLAAC
jgi:hypothetical protein